MSLEPLGWNQRWDDAFAAHREAGLEPARVVREDRDRYLLAGRTGESPGVLAGHLRHAARHRSDLPAVGDWVAVRPGDAVATIRAVLPRSSAFLRKTAGETTEEQVVAANVDTVFLMSGLDGDFNPRRIERYLVAARESGAAPVVVLNKADLAADLEGRRGAVAGVGAPIVAISALRREGLERLGPWLAPGSTVALLGSSGVGKTTLIDALVGEDRRAVRPVREHDSRGRHTTTHRELVLLPCGALLIDTPGMRELQLWSDEGGLDGAFADIAALAERCRFRDCRHVAEPGCAVLAAIDGGALDAGRLASWHKLERELRRLATRQDARARAAEETRWRQISKAMKRHPKADRWR